MKREGNSTEVGESYSNFFFVRSLASDPDCGHSDLKKRGEKEKAVLNIKTD